MKIFLVLIFGFFLALLARVGYLQILRGDDHRARFEESLKYVRLLRPNRGRILDRTGEHPLAEDVACFDLCLDYRFLTHERRWISRRQRKIRQAEHVGQAGAAEVYRRRAAKTWRLAREIAETNGVGLERAVARIRSRVEAIRANVGGPVREERQAHPVVSGLDEKVALADTVGATCRPSRKRWYPRGPLACHILGMCGQADRRDIDAMNLSPQDQPDRLTRLRHNYLPGDEIGKSGVEKACEGILRGRRGYQRFKRTIHGPELLEEEPVENGRDVHLTIDIDLQEYMTGLLDAHGGIGSIVVLSVPQGEVLAMVSLPDYDPNRYRRDRRYFKQVISDEVNLPLLHRAVAKRYPPGSIAKPMTALAGLGSGLITPGTQFNCRGYLHVPTAFRCWIYKQYNRGHGPLDLVGAIKNSCNIYFYLTGEKLGAPQLIEWLRRFGFCDVPGTGLPEERAWMIPTTDWLRRRRPRNPRFTKGDARNIAIGQGFFDATPLHVANAMATIARGGEFISPLLVLEGGPKRVRRKLPLTAEHIAVVSRGMYKVVNEPGGTAYKYFHGPGARPIGVDICGKTGTAETAPQRIDSNRNGRIDSHDQIVRSGDTAWFAGFAPYRNPQIAFAIVMDHAGSGGKKCAPVAAEVVRACRRLGYVR